MSKGPVFVLDGKSNIELTIALHYAEAEQPVQLAGRKGYERDTAKSEK